MERQRKTRRKANAQGLVEFALLVPVLLLLIFGIIDFGWMIFNYAQLYNSAREGARYGSVSGYNATSQYKECTNIKDRIRGLAGFSGITNADITIVYDDGIPFDIDAWIASGETSTTLKSMTAYCKQSTGTFTFYPNHVGTEKPTASGKRSGELNNGDRIVIQVDRNVQFLTPLIRTFAKTGLNMKFYVGRSLFPSGITANTGS